MPSSYGTTATLFLRQAEEGCTIVKIIIAASIGFVLGAASVGWYTLRLLALFSQSQKYQTRSRK